jgi:hypothetical protein
LFAALGSACSGANGAGFGDGGAPPATDTGAGSSDSGGSHPGDSSYSTEGGIMLGDGSTPKDGGSADVIVTSVTTVYAHTDTALYSLDPKAMPPTLALIGSFSGMGDGAYNAITDLAVNAEGEVYVNTESAVFKADVPTSPGPVNLSLIATIATAKDQYFYALAFAPKGFLGSGETLVGGDGSGELYAIDTTGGTLQDLGNFGGVPGTTNGDFFGLSGDVVFYTDAMGTPTGMATIRSCSTSSKGDTTCTSTDDYLAGIDMTALAAAYTSGKKATSLLGGIYGGSTTSVGTGTMYGDIFGLGAWGDTVYGFTRANKTTSTPYLLSISTTTGLGSIVPSSPGFTTDGWSGAGVTTTVTITVPPPPKAPPQPQ